MFSVLQINGTDGKNMKRDEEGEFKQVREMTYASEAIVAEDLDSQLPMALDRWRILKAIRLHNRPRVVVRNLSSCGGTGFKCCQIHQTGP
ncbi:hypothetical protein VFPPC_16961 [Pochonia chlamydosporia 170]|uniref:Uncharacterized protein n=1 Tax=Pochonia chlamydosporia 170 TaxID=1380566 RepID=A0A179EZJ1_METCM|nr:hypothetical protein VFPPC_16961 [Pochonia chlamydosporia 170]OAQ58606.2 hypothetical protein VFPPC_16961 [Pochonia chlamydosporia 170]